MGSSDSKAAAEEKGDSNSKPIAMGADGKKPADYSTNDRTKHGAVVFLNVYDLQDTTQGGRVKKGNTINAGMGFGFYHSGVEIFGIEWSFGGHPDADSKMPGIFPTKPRTALPPHQFHKQIRLGEIVGVRNDDIIKVLRKIEHDWLARSYHVLSHNCNHFGEAFLEALSKEYSVSPAYKVPSWVNRAARFGDTVVPERVYKAMMRRAPQPPQSSGSSFSTSAPPPTQSQSNSNGHTQGHGHGHEEGDAGAADIPLRSPDEMRKMSVKEIKTMMWVHGISWDNCVEKEDLIEAVSQYRAATGK